MNSASATTITVNTSLFAAGDTVFIQNIGAGVSTITAGTATVNTASSLALAQYESGTLYFTAAGTSIFSKADGAPAGGGGKVLQVVYGSTNTSTTIVGPTYTDSTLSASITPSSASSKVLVFTNQFIVFSRSARDQGCVVRLLRGSTSIFEPAPTNTTELGYIDASTGGSVTLKIDMGLQYLDSPSTTSATTYKTQFNGTYNSPGTATAQSNSVYSNIILMEIGA
jgi:hypothetical protein